MRASWRWSLSSRSRATLSALWTLPRCHQSRWCLSTRYWTILRALTSGSGIISWKSAQIRRARVVLCSFSISSARQILLATSPHAHVTFPPPA